MGRASKGFGDTLSGRLLVEGTTDSYFFSHLFVKRGLYEKPKDQVVPKGFGITAKGSYSEIKSGLAEELKIQHLDIIGIVVDADESLDKRWKDLRTHVQSLGYSDIPEKPDPQGSILETEGKKRLGIWLMPDNEINGILEHFIAWMVKDKDANPVWRHVEHSINTLPKNPIFPVFDEKDLAKAQLSTWLAWQKEPGHPIGLAVTKNYVNAGAESADPFIDWIKRLFQLS